MSHFIVFTRSQEPALFLQNVHELMNNPDCTD